MGGSEQDRNISEFDKKETHTEREGGKESQMKREGENKKSKCENIKEDEAK